MRFLLVVLFLCGIANGYPRINTRLRWCCISDHEYDKCGRMSRHVDGAPFPFDCVKETGVDACVTAIKEGRAELITLDGGDIYKYRNDLFVVAAEYYGSLSASYLAVAVIKKGSDAPTGFEGLRNKRSCHTGVGKTAGWNVPMGFMIRQGLNPFDLFESSCAPGANSTKYAVNFPASANRDKWCGQCVGDGDHHNVCDRNQHERYYGYSGAFRCLDEGKGDIAFVKHSTIPKDRYHEFDLLCHDGTTQSSANWADCNLARVPAHAVMAIKTEDGALSPPYQSVLENLNNAMENKALEMTNDGSDLMWKSTVQRFIDPGTVYPNIYLGEEYRCDIQAVQFEEIPKDCLL